VSIFHRPSAIFGNPPPRRFKMDNFSPINLHFSVCTFHFSMIWRFEFRISFYVEAFCVLR
jgi:hypothetical protein